jgi:lysine-N-methylase
MSVSLHPLPLVQNWDCHTCGDCCREYLVGISPEEQRRIEAQGWEKEPDFQGVPLFLRYGHWWSRRTGLNQHSDGTCVFLSNEGRCRIHERFGPEAKPLPCRLYPFILVPVGNQWRVGLRFACPSAAANRGRRGDAHLDEIRKYVGELVTREGLGETPAAPAKLGLAPPPLQGLQRVEWADLERFTAALVAIVRDPRDKLERRLRKCLALARLCRQARFDAIQGGRLKEFFNVITASLDSEVPADPASLPAPGWIGRVLFRQALAIYARKDQGRKRGLSQRGRIALFFAASRFAWGRGPVPKLHALLPDATFEQAEMPAGALPPEAESDLERYYLVKFESMQFCGPTYYHAGFWEGVEALALTYPVIMWLRRLFRHLPAVEALRQALCIADDHYGFNRVLGTMRQRFGFRILARSGELDRLIAWYSR